jgi:hypothetical protein
LPDGEPSAGWGSFAEAARARLSWRLVLAVGVAASLCGVVAGWSARNPDVMAVATDPDALVPGLWLEPRWTTIPRQDSPENQLRYALLQVPREDWAPAFVAVPGYFRQAHEHSFKAYTQLARLYYRSGDRAALLALESALSQWNDAKGYDHELAHVIHIAVKLEQGDYVEVVEGFRKLTRDEVPDMYDHALVELGLEICVDATNAAAHAGAEMILRQDLHQFQARMIRQLYRIELPKMNRALSRAALKKM